MCEDKRNVRMMFVWAVAGVCLDRINKINRIVGVRVESWSSRKEVGTIPLSRLRQGYGGQANSNYFLQLSPNLVNPVNPV